MLAHTVFIFAVIYLSQLCSVVATFDPEAPMTTLAKSDDPKCSEGFYPGFETNAWQFTVPLDAWLSKTGSFLHAECPAMRRVVQKVADELGAYVFAGSCPIGESAFDHKDSMLHTESL
ncbi:hypothetical protein H0H92_001881 [Tricholoma furcatifolium]|nr:hypothetical protein H0H92_001881 [Tricholoma furcatifolium]